jgi:isopentenyldiphosphate isomerase/intracellular septation protein A
MNKISLLKNFTIGFIPLLIFIIVDEFLGLKTALVVAVGVGVIEFVYYYIRYKQIEKFIAFDVALLIIFALISIVLDNDVFFKLKPAFIEFILVILLAVHAFSDKPLLLMMGKRFLKDIKFDKTQIIMVRTVSRILLVALGLHTALIIYAAYFMSKEAWAFISGGLVYIIFALFFAGQYLYFRVFKKNIPSFSAKNGEEWFDLVTPEGKVVGKAPRSAVHGDPTLLHPVIHLHVFNKNGQLYLQKRADNKEVQPGKWDTSVGGHISSGEDVMTALKREAEEELGIKNVSFKPLYRYVMRNAFESELVYSFQAIYNGLIRINKSEISFGRYWRIQEIEHNLGQDLFTPNFEQEFAMLKKVILNHKDTKAQRER